MRQDYVGFSFNQCDEKRLHSTCSTGINCMESGTNTGRKAYSYHEHNHWNTLDTGEREIEGHTSFNHVISKIVGRDENHSGLSGASGSSHRDWDCLDMRDIERPSS